MTSARSPGARVAAAVAALSAAAALWLAAPAALPQAAVRQQAPAAGLTFPQARVKFPQLPQVMFDRADLNGDGLIDRRELPVLQGMYNQSFRAR